MVRFAFLHEPPLMFFSRPQMIGATPEEIAEERLALEPGRVEPLTQAMRNAAMILRDVPAAGTA